MTFFCTGVSVLLMRRSQSSGMPSFAIGTVIRFGYDWAEAWSILSVGGFPFRHWPCRTYHQSLTAVQHVLGGPWWSWTWPGQARPTDCFNTSIFHQTVHLNVVGSRARAPETCPIAPLFRWLAHHEALPTKLDDDTAWTRSCVRKSEGGTKSVEPLPGQRLSGPINNTEIHPLTSDVTCVVKSSKMNKVVGS